MTDKLTPTIKHPERCGPEFDVCECGDYRRDHKNGAGPCVFNGDGWSGGLTHGFTKCAAFRLHRTAPAIALRTKG